MKLWTKWPLLVIALSGAMAGCSDNYLKIEGLAATGAAVADADVSAQCAQGPSLAGKTDANGVFVLTLDGGQAMPCVVKVTKGAITLHSFASEEGRLNVTPLTELVVARALGANPATALSDGLSPANATKLTQGIAAAKVAVKSRVEALTRDSITADLLTGVFAIGDDNDRVLDKFAAKLSAIGQSFASLQEQAAAGVDLVPPVVVASRGELLGTLDLPQSIDQPTMAFLVQQAGAQALAGSPQCGVDVRALRYTTVGVAGEAATASAAMLVPTGCVPNGALVAYAKGTDVDKVRTLANPNDGETFLLMMMYAAQGYTVVATDYLGFGQSNYPFHPYLHAETEASSVIDSIRAARHAADTIELELSGAVFLTGYSQGGHASMAAHRAIESDPALAQEIHVAAGAHLAGPYNMNLALERNDPIAGYQFFVPYMVTSWQKVYGNIYDDVSQVFNAPYAEYIESLLPSTQYDYTSLITSGKLPYGPLPSQARDALFKQSYLTAMEDDAQHPMRVAGRDNDLLGWTPKSMVMLCSGSNDPTVPAAVHQDVAYADFLSRVENSAMVMSVDVDPTIQALYAQDFDISKYHGEYAPPLCAASARQLFNSIILPN